MKKINVNDARSALAKQSIDQFDAIVNQTVLGASNHIKMIGDMIEKIADECVEGKKDIQEMISRIQTVCDYFRQTRGEASQAISNAIDLMISSYESEQSGDVNACAKEVIKRKDNYFVEADEAIKKAIEYGVTLAEGFNNILIYDYSSSVAALINKLKNKNIYIAESRAINGGMPFIKGLKEQTHNIYFFPDAALLHFLKKCDVVFMGAETIYPDGTGFNTIGSDVVGSLCSKLDIPLYFISTLIKLDGRPLYGKEKTIVINDLTDVLLKDLNGEEKAAIDCMCPELIAVSSKDIKGYITEQGIIPSEQLYTIACTYLKTLKGEI